MNKLVKLLGQPRTINHQISHRKISWLELFYDLMFAVVIARLTDCLVVNLSFSTFFNSLLIFGWFIWGWNEMSGYFDNHGNDSIINILAINTEMLLTGIGALFIPEAMAGDYRRLAVVLMLIEFLMAIIWFSLAHFDQIHGAASRTWGSVHLAALIIMIITYFINPLTRLTGLVIGLLLNVLDVIIANPRLAREYHRANLQHQVKDSLIERYGLMTMITLGEIIAGLYESIPHRIVTTNISHFIISMVVIALIAAIYYQVLGTLKIRLASSIATTMTGWLFILNIIMAFYLGVAFQLIAKFENTKQQLMANLFFVTALLLFMVTIRIIVFIGTKVNQEPGERKISWLLGGESLLIIGLAFTPTIVMLSGILIVLLAIIFQGQLNS